MLLHVIMRPLRKRFNDERTSCCYLVVCREKNNEHLWPRSCLASVGVVVVETFNFWLETNGNLFKYLVFCFSCNFSNLGSILVPTCRNINILLSFLVTIY